MLRPNKSVDFQLHSHLAAPTGDGRLPHAASAHAPGREPPNQSAVGHAGAIVARQSALEDVQHVWPGRRLLLVVLAALLDADFTG